MISSLDPTPVSLLDFFTLFLILEHEGLTCFVCPPPQRGVKGFHEKGIRLNLCDQIRSINSNHYAPPGNELKIIALRKPDSILVGFCTNSLAPIVGP